MKVAFCLFFTLALFLCSDAIEEGENPVDCTDFPRQACSKEYKPICGSNSKTYLNRCDFCNAFAESREIIKFNHFGECN